MLIAVAVVGMLVALAGLSVLIAPASLMGWIAGMPPTARFRGAILGRAAAGVLFILAAPQTRWPHVIRVIGWIAIVAAVGVLLLGQTRLDKIVEGVTDWPAGVMRAWGLVAVAAGGALVMATL